MTDLTPALLDHLDALAKAATPGPWRYYGACRVSDDGPDVVLAQTYRNDDSWFIAACSPDVIRALTSALREARAENARLRVIATREVADAIVRSKERATRVYWTDYVTGEPTESPVDMPSSEMSAANEVCGFFRVLRVWVLESENAALRAAMPSEDEAWAVDSILYSDSVRVGHEAYVESVAAWLARVAEVSRG